MWPANSPDLNLVYRQLQRYQSDNITSSFNVPGVVVTNVVVGSIDVVVSSMVVVVVCSVVAAEVVVVSSVVVVTTTICSAVQ